MFIFISSSKYKKYINNLFIKYLLNYKAKSLIKIIIIINWLTLFLAGETHSARI